MRPPWSIVGTGQPDLYAFANSMNCETKDTKHYEKQQTAKRIIVTRETPAYGLQSLKKSAILHCCTVQTQVFE